MKTPSYWASEIWAQKHMPAYVYVLEIKWLFDLPFSRKENGFVGILPVWPQRKALSGDTQV